MQSSILSPVDLSPVDVSGSTESSATAVSWGPIIAGAFAASTLTFILMLLGSGLGLSMVSPWSGSGASVTTFAVSTAIWLIIVQWLSSGVGGYLAGRLRTKWVDIHTDEVFFRDTAHGFLTWAGATIVSAAFLGSAASALVGAAGDIAGKATGTAAVMATAAGAG